MNRVYAWITAAAISLSVQGAIAADPHSGAVRLRAESFIEHMVSDEPFANAPVGVLAVTLSGDTLACWQSGLRLVPASNVKLITCAAALETLGPDWRYPTTLAYSGSISAEGRLRGDLYIVGGADPTTGAKDPTSPDVSVTFARWKRLLDRAGIKSVEGSVIGDGRILPPDGGSPDWSSEDLGFYFGAIPEGLNFYKNTHDMQVLPGSAPGEKVQIEEIYPELPWMNYSHSATTGPAGSGDRLYYECSGIVPMAGMYGTLGIDKGKRREQCTNRFGALTCAQRFCAFLQEAGISVGGSFADIDLNGRIRKGFHDAGAPADSLTIIGSAESAPLLNIIKECLFESDNFYAETLLKTLGIKYKGSPQYDSCLVVEKQVLRSLGANPAGMQLRDGSGLSRKNYVSAEYFVRLLSAVAAGPDGSTFASALPSPGQGSLAGNMSKQTPEFRGRIKMKSGSMDGIRCYSGYILPAGTVLPSARTGGAPGTGDTRTGEAPQAGAPGSLPEDTIVFSILTNNVTAPSLRSRPILDRLIWILAQ